MTRRVLGWAFVIGLTACSSSENDGAAPAGPPPAVSRPAAGCAPGELAENGGCVAAGAVCAPGFSADPARGTCRPVRAEKCGPGTASVVGQAACVAVGNATCASGFASDGAGGCAPVLPASACAPGTREALGSATCVAVSDCAAAFPPANATRFVDPTFQATQLDPTHFRTIHEALANAPSGAVVAIAAGVYKEALTISTGAITLVGRCAGETILEPPPPVTGATHGIEITTSGDVALRALTIRGFSSGVVATGPTTLDGVEVIAAAPPGGGASYGVDAWPGAKVTMTSSSVRGDGNGAATFESAGLRARGATVALDDVTIAGVSGIGASLASAANVTAKGLVVVRTTAVQNGLKSGLAVNVDGASTFDGERIAVRGASFAALAASALHSAVHVRQSTFESVAVSHFGQVDAAIGLGATEGATLDVTSSTIRDAAGAALLVAEAGALNATDVSAVTCGGDGQAPGAITSIGGAMTLTRGAILGPRFAGAVLDQAGTIHVSRVLVADAVPGASGAEGGGVDIVEGTLDGEELTIERASLYGMSLVKGARAKLSRLAIVDTVASRAADGTSLGTGLSLDQTGALELESAYVKGSVGFGAMIRRGATLTARGIYLDGVAPIGKSAAGYGIQLLEGSHVTLDGFAIENAYASGIVAGDDGTAIDLAHGLLADAKYDARTQTAKGLSAQGGAHATLRGVRVTNSQGVAVYGSRNGTTIAIEGCVIDGITPGKTGELGDAFIATDGATGTITGTRLAHAARAAAVFAGGTGRLDRCAIEASAVGLHVQDGSNLVESDDPSAPAPLEVRVDSATTFVDLGAKVGTGTIPLPPAP